jgi:leader peptidase (prepilin peptidase)/N-methyltransferase
VTVAQTIDNGLDSVPQLSLSTPRSRCPHCGTPIAWFDNVPVVSWLMLRGRCRACRAPISSRYPLIEVLTAGLFMLAGLHYPGDWLGLAWCAWLATLVTLSGIDWDTTLLPDDLTLPLLWGGLILSLAGSTLPPSAAVLGAAIGWGSLWLVHFLFLKITGRQGMGAGDFKLLGALGAWLGPWAILPVVLVASLSGAIVGVTMKVRGALREGLYVPFGPFLAAGGVVVWAVGAERLLAALGW